MPKTKKTKSRITTINFEGGKKPMYGRDICPNIYEVGDRCKKCCFNLDLKRVAYLNGRRARKFGMDIKKDALDKLMVFECSGCAVLDEICPECIVDTRNMENESVIGLIDERIVNGNIACKPAHVYPREDNKELLHCEICGKDFYHDEVKHTLDIITLLNTEKKYEKSKGEKNK